MIDIERDGSSVVVKTPFQNESKTKGESIEVFTGDGGTTNRFLLALLSKGKNIN